MRTKLFILLFVLLSMTSSTVINKDESSSDSSNIIELESKKFRNLTSGSHVLTVYKVYGHKVLVIEGQNEDVTAIKLD